MGKTAAAPPRHADRETFGVCGRIGGVERTVACKRKDAVERTLLDLTVIGPHLPQAELQIVVAALVRNEPVERVVQLVRRLNAVQREVGGLGVQSRVTERRRLDRHVATRFEIGRRAAIDVLLRYRRAQGIQFRAPSTRL